MKITRSELKKMITEIILSEGTTSGNMAEVISRLNGLVSDIEHAAKGNNSSYNDEPHPEVVKIVKLVNDLRNVIKKFNSIKDKKFELQFRDIL